MGACEGVLDYDCEGGQKFTGPGTRRWSCWVLEAERNSTLEKVGRLEDSTEEKSEVVTSTAEVYGTAPSSEILGAFTPGVTGH